MRFAIVFAPEYNQSSIEGKTRRLVQLHHVRCRRQLGREERVEPLGQRKSVYSRTVLMPT